MMEYEYVLARVDVLRIWNFYPTMEAAQAAMPEVNSREKQQYTPMTYADYKAAERSALLDSPAEQITGERYMEMLEVLPPMKWERRDGFESFLMSEFYTGVYTNQYAQRGYGETATYWSKMVDATDRSTWMK